MNYKFLFTLVFCSLFVLYYITLIVVQVDDITVFSSYYGDACNIVRQSKWPTFAVVTRQEEGPFTFNTERLTMETCGYRFMYSQRWTLEHRPLVGDHIHLGIAVSINGHQITLRDRNMTEHIPYEDFHPTCNNPPKYAYTKKWYHTGVHTHCDNIVHVHPWSAPRKLRVTGREVTLAMWFESVGIATHGNSIRVPGYDYKDNWIMKYYVNVTDQYPVVITQDVEEISNLWLVDHHGFIKLFHGSEPDKSLDVLGYYSKSRLGGKYPSRIK